MSTITESRTAYDENLRQFMLSLYNYTAAGIALSGITAYLMYASGLAAAMGPLMWVFVFAPLAMIFIFGIGQTSWSFDAVRAFYFVFTAVMGVSLAPIFTVYTGTSIAQVFFITAATFTSASIFGYTTKRDLSSWGSFLLVGLIGIIIASIVNIFLQNSAMQFAISVIGVLIFTGLTAFDTQTAKSVFVHGRMSAEDTAKFAISTAMSLYLNFVNLFQMLLHLLGERE